LEDIGRRADDEMKEEEEEEEEEEVRLVRGKILSTSTYPIRHVSQISSGTKSLKRPKKECQGDTNERQSLTEHC
jgi:hypothetical protein